MMKRFVYIITDAKRTSLQVGMSSDLLKTINFYREIPNLLFDSASQMSRLIYFEELRDDESARHRFDLICRYTRVQKEKLIRDVNPDWLDFGIALNYEDKVLQSEIEEVQKIRKAA